jgi:hypothetical protein
MLTPSSQTIPLKTDRPMHTLRDHALYQISKRLMYALRDSRRDGKAKQNRLRRSDCTLHMYAKG